MAPRVTTRDLAEEISHYLSRHSTSVGEPYDFNIKVGVLRIPQRVRERVPEDTIQRIVEEEMRDDLSGLVDWIRGDFDWVSNWSQEGRSGGWLVLYTDEPVLSFVEEEEDFDELQQRLTDLDTIKSRVRVTVRDLEQRMASYDFWARAAAELRRPRRDWDPRA